MWYGQEKPASAETLSDAVSCGMWSATSPQAVSAIGSPGQHSGRRDLNLRLLPRSRHCERYGEQGRRNEQPSEHDGPSTFRLSRICEAGSDSQVRTSIRALRKPLS